MRVVQGIQSLSQQLVHPVVTIGNFDGVHQGHQEIIQQAIDQARARKGMAVALTFRPHPQVALHPEVNLPLLLTYDEKLELMQSLGLDLVIEEPFSREFSTTPAETFFTDILMRRLNAEAIVIGYDFGFGKGRQGHIEALSRFCQKVGVQLTIVQPQRVDSEIVSSSRIRQHLLAGELEIASKLLGRDFFYRGVVVKGFGRGRQLGYPTANLKLESGKLALPYGVYATWALYKGTRYPSVTNVGVRPTFSAEDAQAAGHVFPAVVETYLLDQDIDLYGSILEVRFVKRMREERKFSGPDKFEQLKQQIVRDIDETRVVLRRLG
jgi:riboflavin kinase / FMN adenylyltransferase